MDNDEPELIKFTATVERISTTLDGAIRLTMDLDGGAIDQASRLMQVKRLNELLEIVAVVVK